MSLKEPSFIAREIVFRTLQEEFIRQLDFQQSIGDSSARHPHPTFSIDEVHLVWFCYILGGWKALVSTSLPYQMYYEVTYNKETKDTYLDIYKKVSNLVIPKRELT